MKVEEVVLNNFKSFGKKTRIPFSDGFNAISGPNGSGKSNIIDAFCFVLGTSTTKDLRADNLTDLIFQGENGKNPNFAEVTLKLDNSEGELPTSDDNVTITRKVKRTDKGYYSYYYLNGNSVTLTEIHEFISEAGISEEGYNIVMQGDVTRITEVGSTERRRIIDEIAGVSEFEKKKEKAFEELDAVKDEIDRVEIILSEIKDRLEEVEDERKDALKYRDLKERKKELDLYLIASKKDKIKSDIERIDKVLNKKEVEKDEYASNLVDLKKEIDTIKRELEELNQEISRKGEEEQIEIKREIEEIKGEISRGHDSIEMMEESIEDVQEEKKKIYSKRNSLKEKIDSLNEDKEKLDIQLSNIQNEIDSLKQEKQKYKDKIEEIDDESFKVKEKVSELKKELEELREQKNRFFKQKDRVLDSLRRKEDEIREIEERISDFKDKKQELIDSEPELEEKISGYIKKKKSHEDSKSELERDKLYKKRELKELEEKQRKKERKLAKAEAKKQAAEEIDNKYSRPVREILKAKSNRILNGVYGTISELGKVEEKYSTALEIAAGGRMQSIVVETDSDAEECINYLKRNNLGRATFLPINKIQYKPPRSRAKQALNSSGAVDLAINLVDFEEKFKPAFWYVFRDTVIMDDLKAARKNMGGVRMVTLEGDLVDPGGAMSGGSKKKSRFKFTVDDEKQVSKLKDEIQKIEKEIRKKNNEIKNLEEGIERLEAKINEKNTKIDELEKKLETQRRDIEKYEDEIKRKQEKKEKVIEEKESQQTEIKELEEKINELDSEIQEKKQKISDLEERVENTEIPKYMDEIDRINSEIERLRDVTNNVENKLNQKELEIEYAERNLEEQKQNKKELKEKEEKLKNDIKDKKKEIEDLKGELKEKEQEDKEINKRLKELRSERDELLGDLSELEKKESAANKNLEQLETKIKQLKEERKEKKTQINEVEEELGDFEVDEELPSPSEIQSEITDIEEDLKKLEPVNMKAIDEYENIKERKENLEGRINTLTEEREGIIDRIEKYNEMKTEVFMKTFNEINRNFQEVFSQLSPGGQAELILEEPESPFEGGLTIEAIPEGKTVRRLDAMSGGEKSLTALSFIFAIQRYDPAPFYAFDEIDMFLDGANVERVANMIERLSDKAQFIVVSLRKPTIESSDQTIGITMQENGVSEATGVMLNGN